MSHTTRYGNTYTDQEWIEMQAEFKQQEKEDNELQEKINGMIKYLKHQLSEEGLSIKQINQVAKLFRYFEYPEANIQWSSQSRKEKIDNLWERWDIATNKIYINIIIGNMEKQDEL